MGWFTSATLRKRFSPLCLKVKSLLWQSRYHYPNCVLFVTAPILMFCPQVALPAHVFALVNPLVGSLGRLQRGVGWFIQAMTYFPALIMLLCLRSQINKTSLSAPFPEECSQRLLTTLNYSYGQHGNKRMCCKTELFNNNSLAHNSHSFPLCCSMPFILIHNICFPDHKNSLIWRQWVDWT